MSMGVTNSNKTVELLKNFPITGVDTKIIVKVYQFKDSKGDSYRQLEIELKGSETGIVVEMDELEFMEGNLRIEEINAMYKVGSMVIPKELKEWKRFKVVGTGTLIFKPTTQHYMLNKLNKNATLILENGVFCSCEGSYKDVRLSFNLTTKEYYNSLYDLKGNRQTFLKGYGLIIMKTPFKENEIKQVQLNNSLINIDLRSVFMRTAGIQIEGKSNIISNNGLNGVVMKGSGTIGMCALLGEHVKENDVGRYLTKDLFLKKEVEVVDKDNKGGSKLKIPSVNIPTNPLDIRPKLNKE